jgi:TetR/AcrR family transcriptional regulator, mexJK operon transcriptional repressor
MTAALEISPIRRGRKFDQVLEGAKTVFLRDGFEGASVDDIARAAGVSKATLYAYFPDKRLIFLEVARSECQRQADMASSPLDGEMTTHDMLTSAARQIAGFLISDVALKIFRIAVAESERFPELGRSFYDSGPLVIRSGVEEFLHKAVAKGDLVIPDIHLAAEQFCELCKGDLVLRRIFGIDTKTPQPVLDRTAAAAVEMFLARYGVRPPA